MNDKKLFLSGAEAAARAVNESEVKILKCGLSELPLKIFTYTESKLEIVPHPSPAHFLPSSAGLRVFLCFEENEFVLYFFTILPILLRKNSGGIVILIISNRKEEKTGRFPPFLSTLADTAGVPFLEASSPSTIYKAIKDGYKNSEAFQLPVIIRISRDLLSYHQSCAGGEKENITVKPHLSKETLNSETYNNQEENFSNIEKRLKDYHQNVEKIKDEVSFSKNYFEQYKSPFFCAGCPLSAMLHIFKKGLYANGLSLNDILLYTNLECIKDVDSDWLGHFESLSFASVVDWVEALLETKYHKPLVLFINSDALTPPLKEKLSKSLKTVLLFIFDDNCRRERNNFPKITPQNGEKIDIYNMKKSSIMVKNALAQNKVSLFKSDGNIFYEKKKFFIVKDNCTGIETCRNNCLEETLCPAITLSPLNKAEILQDVCIRCGLCSEICTYNAIKKVRKLK